MRLRLIPIILTGAAVASLNPSPVSAQDARSINDAVHEIVSRVLPTMYQGRDRGPEQTEQFSRKVKLGRDGRVTITNIAGEIVVTAGSGDEVSIEATKRTRSNKSALDRATIKVEEGAGRVDIKTEYAEGTDNAARVDYNVTVPASAALEVHAISGSVHVTGVQGSVRVETISGSVITASTPRVEVAKSVSGTVEITGTSTDGDLSAGSISGNVRIKGVKARSIRMNTISGSLGVSDATCDRVDMKSLSGTVEYSGALAKGGRYDLTSHSGTVHMILSGDVGFQLDANTFNGSIDSDLPLTVGGDADARGRRRPGVSSRAMHATFGDGSALLTLHTFSGPIVISKK